MAFKNITSERLLIRSLSAEDAEKMSSYRSLPEVSQFQSWRQYSYKEALSLIKNMSGADPSTKGRWFQFGVVLKTTEELIGDIGFLNTDENKKSWIGFTLDSRHWGKGYAFESVRAILNYYSTLGITEVWASVDPENDPSAKLLKKLNFILKEEKPKDHIYGISFS